ncbi:hypothetical protein D9611_003657 [Ephemerocybe angulata]|uniref:Uncharacterized protein n=1 Tax=Ephemerocybe angulata TaxID=980116 RepID=A0A8H5EYF5_9AGAR|nr:hypothetical protein D9611_003657 [Tulosesus angulatus]
MLKSGLSSSQAGLKILYSASWRTAGAQKLTRPAGSAPYSTSPKSDGDSSPPDVTVRPQGHGSLTFPLPPLPHSKPRPSASGPSSNAAFISELLKSVPAPPNSEPSPSAPSNPPSNVTPIDPKALSELLALLENSNSKDICNSDTLHAIHTTPSLKSLFESPQTFLVLAVDLALAHSQDPTTDPARHLPVLIRLAHHLQVPLTNRDFPLLTNTLFGFNTPEANRLVTALIDAVLATYGPTAALLHFKARSATRQMDFTWLPTFLPTFKALKLWPTRSTFHVMLKAALIMRQQRRDGESASAASERVQDILNIMQRHGHAPDERTDALILRHTYTSSREGPTGSGLRDLDKGALAAIAEQPLENRKLNILNNLLSARIGEKPPRDVGELLDMLGGTEEGRRVAEIVRGSALGVAASPPKSPSAETSPEEQRPESQSQLIQHPPNPTTYKNLIAGIALKHKDLDTGALLLHELLSRGFTVPDSLLRYLVHTSLLRARGAQNIPVVRIDKDTDKFDEGQDGGGEKTDNGIVLAIRILASTCDARKTPVEAFMKICPSEFRVHPWPTRTEDGSETYVLGPREFDSVSDSGEGGRGQPGQKPPSAEVFKVFMRGALGLRNRMWDATGEAVLSVMRENGVEVDEEARELASELQAKGRGSGGGRGIGLHEGSFSR